MTIENPTQCTRCGRAGFVEELGTVCLMLRDGYPCPGMMENAAKLAADKAVLRPKDVN
jgi:hypothetical protein